MRAQNLDNGSTYRGALLSLCCARLGIALVHAKPYDPEARGKMERFYADQRITRRIAAVPTARIVETRHSMKPWGGRHAA